jgi:hypothetical protein
MRQLLKFESSVSRVMLVLGGHGRVQGAAAGGWQHPQALLSLRPATAAAGLPALPHVAAAQAYSSSFSLQHGSRSYSQSAVAAEAVSSRRKTSPPQAYDAQQIQVRLQSSSCCARAVTDPGMHAHQIMQALHGHARHKLESSACRIG